MLFCEFTKPINYVLFQGITWVTNLGSNVIQFNLSTSYTDNRIVIPVVEGSSPFSHPIFSLCSPLTLKLSAFLMNINFTCHNLSRCILVAQVTLNPVKFSKLGTNTRPYPHHWYGLINFANLVNLLSVSCTFRA